MLRAGSAEIRIGQAVDRWQVLACEMRESSPWTLVRRVRVLAGELPDAATPIELVAVRSLVTRVLSEIARSLGSVDRAAVSDSLIAWAASPATAETWRGDLLGLLDVWSRALQENCAPAREAQLDPRLNRALQFLDAHFTNSSVSLDDLAGAIHLSKYHTSRFLRRTTGRGFTEHVHSRRIVDAQRLLRTSLYSVKEIAFMVGYANCSQFGRHFKHLTGKTPGDYRSSAGATVRDESQ
jgi:AraC-like DNA-binding protein